MNSSTTRPLSLLLVIASVLLHGCAPKAKLLESSITTDLQEGMNASPDTHVTLNHDVFSELLKRYANPNTGRVDYKGLKQNQDKLLSYTQKTVAKAPLKKLAKAEQKALLINAYNAYTLQLILENYPGIKSIKSLEKPWDTKRYKVGGHTLSLNDMEHGILRPLYKDPRIHFAVNCASIGCPPLQNTAYQASMLDKQLTHAARQTLSSERYATVREDVLHLTAILDWYGKDFTNASFSHTKETVALAISPWSPEPIQAFVQRKKGHPKVSFLDYNWSLNDIP